MKTKPKTTPENIRIGAPYDNPMFESLCREMGIWGTPQAALCAVFWRVATDRPAPAPQLHKLNAAGTVAVASEYFWQPITTCPRGCKVQLLNPGGVAIYGNYDGKEADWLGWAPLPRKPVTNTPTQVAP